MWRRVLSEIVKMAMAGKLWAYGLVVLAGFALTCSATTYIVGDSSGWDISSDLDTWPQSKRFFVGDVLVFQYSSSDSLNEVTKENFNSCNTTNVLRAYSTGNTTVTLSKPGERYFVSGNKLHCLGGMKLQLNVENNQAYSPAAAPQQQPPSGATDLPQPSSKSDNNSPSAAAGFVIGGRDALVLVFVGYVATLITGVFDI